MSTHSFKKIAGSIGAALAVAYASGASATITAPGGFGEAFMHFTDFQFRIGDGAAGLSPLGALGTGGTSGTEVSNAVAFLNGVGAAGTGCGTTNLGVGYTCLATIGAGFAPAGSTTPQTADPLSPAGDGSGSLSSSSGDSRIGTAEVYLHSLSQLTGGGDTNAGSTQDLFAKFDVSTLAGPALPVEMSFQAESFVRAGLGQDHISASGTTTFSINVKRNGILGFMWTPNGDTTTDLVCINWAVGLCNSFGDPFSLNANVSIEHEVADNFAISDGSQVPYTGTGMAPKGFFEAELTLPSGFQYNVEITGRVTSSTRIPEPGTIALLGLGLFGLGAAVRRKQ